jgi:ribosomal protein S18 acetylase RimI-like enzyme
VKVELADPTHAAALARLHAEALPRSMLTQLGHDALVRFYGWAVLGPVEHTYVALDGEVIGGCMLSDEPQSMLARFTRFAPVQFAKDLGSQLITNSDLRHRFLRRLRERDAGDGPHAPEVTQIFTDGRRRGQGIGAALLRRCEEDLRARGGTKYFVHTERDDNEAGIRFYQREGFRQIAESRSFGTPFLVMQKDL